MLVYDHYQSLLVGKIKFTLLHENAISLFSMLLCILCLHPRTRSLLTRFLSPCAVYVCEFSGHIDPPNLTNHSICATI